MCDRCIGRREGGHGSGGIRGKAPSVAESLVQAAAPARPGIGCNREKLERVAVLGGGERCSGDSSPRTLRRERLEHCVDKWRIEAAAATDIDLRGLDNESLRLDGSARQDIHRQEVVPRMLSIGVT